MEGEEPWMEELKRAVRTRGELSQELGRSIPPVNYPIFLPRPFLARIKKAGPESALWKQFVPDKRENSPRGKEDPIGDGLHNPVGNVIHRYRNRALLMPSPHCPVACRYCFRKNELYGQKALFAPSLSGAYDYIEKHPEINEVILSGGDPLILGDGKLEKIFRRLSTITHVADVRIHTRFPVVLPERITTEFLALLGQWAREFRFFHLVIHTNHGSELEDTRVSRALRALGKVPIHLLSQSVLLREVNDSPQALQELFEGLLHLGVRPYYLHFPDPVKGGAHFLLGREKSGGIYGALQRELPGWAIPKFVVDSPGGKIPVAKSLPGA